MLNLIPVILLSLFLFFVTRQLLNNYRVNRVIYSDHGRRYLHNLEQTGIAVGQNDLDRLAALVVEREEMQKAAREAGYDLDLIDGSFRSRFGMNPNKLLERSLAKPSRAPTAPSEPGRSVDGADKKWSPELIEELHTYGRNGVEFLRKTMEDMRPELRSTQDDVRLRLQYFVHAHVLVWFTISLAIPVEFGVKFWNAHLELLRKDLVDQGFDARTVDGLEPAMRRIWLRYAKSSERGGNPSTAHYRIILEDFLGSPEDTVAMTAVASVVSEIMIPCRRALERDLPELVSRQPR